MFDWRHKLRGRSDTARPAARDATDPDDRGARAPADQAGDYEIPIREGVEETGPALKNRSEPRPTQ